MKTLSKLTFGALAALAVMLLISTPITQAGDHGSRGGDNKRGDHDRRDARATFTKWVTAFPNQPGRIIDMAGIVDSND